MMRQLAIPALTKQLFLKILHCTRINNCKVPAEPTENKVISLIKDTVMTLGMIKSIADLVNKEFNKFQIWKSLI